MARQTGVPSGTPDVCLAVARQYGALLRYALGAARGGAVETDPLSPKVVGGPCALAPFHTP